MSTTTTALGTEQAGMRELQRKMIGHGMLILLIGMLAGIGLLVSLVGGLEVVPGSVLPIHLPGNGEAWVRIHLGQMLNAFLIVLVALVLPVIGCAGKAAQRIGWLTVATGWANTVFYWAALFAPNRALTFGHNRLGTANLASAIGLIPALVFALVSMVVVVLLAVRAFRRAV